MIVSLTAHARPRYLEEVLDALAIADAHLDEHVFLVVGVDPSPRLDEVLATIWSRRPKRGTYVTVNDEIKGCAGNTLLTVQEAFRVAAHFSEDYVQHLEEDFVLAPDALCLSAWIRDTYRDDPTALCGGVSTAHAATPDEYLAVHKSGWFHCQGWSTWADRWHEKLEPAWRATNLPDIVLPGDVALGGWAQNFNDHLLPQHNGFQVIPRLSRVKHIGLEGGLHTTPVTFERDLPRVFAADVVIPNGPYSSLSTVESIKP